MSTETTAGSLLIVSCLTLLSLGSCSSGGASSEGLTNDGGSDAPPGAESDAVLGGRWEPLFSGKERDFPNSSPSLDVAADYAHLVYTDKTKSIAYVLANAAGTITSLKFPQGVKGLARIALRGDGASDVITVDMFNNIVTSYRRTPGSMALVPGPPLDPSTPLSPSTLEAISFGGDVVVAGLVTPPGAAAQDVGVFRLGSSSWERFGTFPIAATVARTRLATDGERLALFTLEGPSRRTVRLWQSDTWTELSGLPDAGDIGIASLLVDRERVFYLEFQGGSGVSVLWMHDGRVWQEWARSDPSEGFHGLVMHGGVLYTMFGDAANEGLPKTTGIARLDRGLVTRAIFDAQSAIANIDPDSRHDVMSLEESGFVSRGGDLWLFYEEGPSGASTIRLYKHAARSAR